MADATRAWSLDLFCEGLRARSRSSIHKTVLQGGPQQGGASGPATSASGQLDPRLMVRDLCPPKRAALWQYLRGVAPGLGAMVSVLPPHHLRVKELLESIEVFLHIQKLLKKMPTRTTRSTTKRRITTIYDVGCGHGLVGMLCAAAFPNIRVHALDHTPRSSFDAQRDAFASTGTALDNLTFQAGDLSALNDINDDNNDNDNAKTYDCDDDNNNNDDNEQEENSSLLLCVHGCKSLTHESIELAARKGWAWLAVPCCLQSEHHLPDKTSLHRLPDQTRFAVLCGALAFKHEAETLAYIDPRITARGIVLSSSGSGA
jgi:SAM-dependent methyltransferase